MINKSKLYNILINNTIYHSFQNDHFFILLKYALQVFLILILLYL